MKCPACQSDNREGVRFCEECGAKFEIECPTCKALIPLGKNFCGECGNKVAKPEPASEIEYDQPLTYTPNFLADKILTTRTAMEGERKRVTVLFADVADFTKISERLDPEQVHEIMDGCFKILMDEIHKHEGTINQFTGDGLMALFGAPLAHEDHARRACHAALSVQQAMGHFAEKVGGDYGIAFKLRIGLNSGPVIVGAIGDDLRMDYTAVGDTTNMASRMESLAQPGTVLISKNTRRLVKDHFGLKALGKVSVKGKEEPQEVFELVKAGGYATRIQAAAAKELTRFVGRKNSMAALMDAYEKVKAGTGQVVGVVGEAGVGKSRLLLEFRKRLPRGEVGYLEGRCIHFGSAIPYIPILDILKSYFHITEGESEPAVRKRVREKILGLDKTLQGLLPPIFDLLSLKVQDERYLKLESRVKKEKLFEALRDLIVRGSQERLLVLAVEDLHWIDKTTEEFLDYFIGWLATARVMLILLYRPEYSHLWANKSYFNRIGVGQLTLKSSAELVKAILGGGETAPELSELILNRAAGNPLFMEELTHSLLENGSIEIKDKRYVLCRVPSDLQVPDTVQGIIAARIDRLEESLKRIMQVAAVIGREFSFRLLQAISGLREDLKHQLLNLQGLEFIYEKSLFPELEYIFKHALVQEVAYNSLLSTRRKEIHQRIGRAIEALYASNLAEFYEVLAYHYGRSDNKEKAFEYLNLANQKAAKLNAMQDAKAYFREALGLLDTLPEIKINQERRISLLVNQEFVFVFLFKFPEYYELLTRFEPMATELDNPNLQAKYYVAMGHCEYSFGYFDQAIQRAKEALKLFQASESEDNSLAYLLAQWCYLLKGDYAQVIILKNGVIKKNKQHCNLLSYVWTLSASSLAHSFLGHWKEALKEGKEALRAAKEFCDNSLIGYAGWTICYAYICKGDLNRAIEHGELAVEAAPTSADKVWAQTNLANALIRAGALDKGVKMLEAILELSQGFIPSYLYITLYLGEGYLLRGEYEKARQTLHEFEEMAKRCGSRGILAVGHRLQGELALKTDPTKAAHHFEECISLLQDIKAENMLALAYASYGRYNKIKGNGAMARDYLNRALEIFERLGTLLEPDKVREDLAQLSEG